MSLRTICFHGPESTGKSTLAARLAAHLGTELVGEYGREWCEANGTYTSMADLVDIATEHLHRIGEARARAEAKGAQWLVLDTDPVMTAVWAEMLHGNQHRFFGTLPHITDLYLVPDVDLRWVEDGLRYFGDPDIRRRFMELSLQELDRRHLPYAMIRGKDDARFANVLKAVRTQFG
jgi:NadR type nicotinamide-nucleotide adenylyltransferase